MPERHRSDYHNQHRRGPAVVCALVLPFVHLELKSSSKVYDFCLRLRRT